MLTIRLPLALAAACGLLAGCAGTARDYPSLSIRDAERVSGSFVPDAGTAGQTAPAPAPAGLDARLAQLLADARTAHGDFLTAAPQAERTVTAGAGAAIASDNWAAAQVALADLDSARSRAAISLGDLDLLYADATLAWQERAAITQVRDQVIALVAEEDAILARLRGRVAGS